ncbi:nucleotidyltransferase family protein [Alkalihalobacillus sp. 1P02AB]|uniref:nucleotidyltransferase family protein n=1 Tax=Alkalihalobacillus sp. 1P02AB TaxID=3132260 RepID=UPI0039A6BCA1
MKTHRIVGLYLAAGLSTRMGTSKFLLRVNDEVLGVIALKKALQSSLEHIFVVISKTEQKEEVESSLTKKERKKMSFVFNKNPNLGQSQSLKCGLKMAIEDDVDGVMILLADQPLMTNQMIDLLINKYESVIQKGQSVDYIVSECQNIIQPPILCLRSTFEQLFLLSGDQGAKKLIQQTNAHKVVKLKYDQKELFFDIDTKEQFEWFINRSGKK